MATQIPDARVVSPSGTEEEQQAARNAAIASFVLGLEAPGDVAPPSPSGLRTVLFTDLVRHTEMMQRLGDARGREVLREHERITRETLLRHNGAEVKSMGDGFMASFGSVNGAMECAIALQRAFAKRNERAPEKLAVRAGLNAGEPIEEDGDLFGSTVIVASRIASHASGGEILASDVVRQLAAGKGFSFSDRGVTALKGFDEPVRVWEVWWRE
jgi:class 3 adenylate cyclase